jgi:hypothetical protein
VNDWLFVKSNLELYSADVTRALGLLLNCMIINLDYKLEVGSPFGLGH